MRSVLLIAAINLTLPVLIHSLECYVSVNLNTVQPQDERDQPTKKQCEALDFEPSEKGFRCVTVTAESGTKSRLFLH